MKKILLTSVTLLATVTLVGSANAVDTALRSQSETVILTSSNSPQNTHVSQLANNATLVTWQEEIDGKYFLKARIVSATKKLGAVQTINSTAAIMLDRHSGTQNTVVANRSGKVFAIWVTQGKRYGVESQTIWGRTSNNGTNWSKAFVIVPGLTVSGDSMFCEDDPGRSPGCGYTSIQAAIDDRGRLAVMTLDNYESKGIRYRVKASSLNGKWSNFATLAEVPDTRASDIAGLASGFAANATSYQSSANSAVRTKFYDPKLEAWTKTYTATTTSRNDVYRSQWLQKDKNNLTLAIAVENGGLSYRNFNLSNMQWSNDLVVIQAPEAEHVYQNLQAGLVGNDLVVLYRDYDRNSNKTELKVVTFSSGTATTKVLETEAGSSVLFYAGATSSNTPLVAYSLGAAGTKIGGITDASPPALISSTLGQLWMVSLTKTSADKVLALAVIQSIADGKFRLVLLTGSAN